MSRPQLLFALLALAAAVVCVRLGFWQLSRLGERRERNALVAARLAAPPVPLAGLPRDTALLRFRRVTFAGTYDYEHQVILTNRSRSGSPGVHFVTPVRVAGSDSAVLVNRGWVYSPDGTTVDPAFWREADSVIVTGFVEPFPPPREGSTGVPGHPDARRWLSREEMARRTGYPVAPFYVVLVGDSSAASDSVPPRLTAPPLDEGPHLGYAFQWFAFAAVAVVGTGIFLTAERRRGSRTTPRDPSLSRTP